MNKFNLISKKDQNIIKQFMKDRDLPDWFRGLSTFQREAADSLLNCIRDDSEQATSHRVRDALRRIGIEPLVGPSKIKFVMQLSRGNDIAFLWFLMELFYRSYRPEQRVHNQKYSVNEQIFITIIAYLDTIPTLRELDKLLPKYLHHSKTKNPALRKRRTKPPPVFPYFQKQPRPKLYGKSLILKEIDNVANFSEYEKYRNPNYIVSNETNRWFASYELKKSKRIAEGIIKDQIDAIFDKELEPNKANKDSLALCAHHRNVQAMKESLRNELKVTRRKECEKYFDVKEHFKKQSYNRVMNQLNSEINKVSETFRKYVNENLKRNKTFHAGNVGSEKQQINDETSDLYDFGHNATITTKCKYFKAPTPNKPFKFNYNRIFDLGAKNPIKDTVTLALNADSSATPSLEHNRAVTKCCKQIWSQEVKNHNLIFKRNQKAKQTSHIKQIEKDQFSQFNPDQDQNQNQNHYYDPRNTKLMQSMLLKALQEIKKNKKYVLASLPDAHKLPILREWVKNRYGLVYTREEKIRSFKATKTVFQALRNNALRVRIPHLDDLSRKRMVSYGCKKYLLRKTNYLKEIYEHNFKESLLEDARIYWAAMRPYQCSKGPPRNEFFAYLPARKNDVHMFRPWKVREFIHAKEAWDKRQRTQKSEFSK